MDPHHLRDEADLAARVAAGPFLLFKQSFRCPVSMRAFDAYRAFATAHPEVATGWLDVVEQRPFSLAVATSTGVTHESPQALLFRDGRVAWHASHGRITADALAAATAAR
jgi:bacillithiol system protein YtxJ